MMDVMRTEFEFTLPRGYIDQAGNLHREGVMRLATALDEITPLRDLRVRSNDAYLIIIILSRVITKLGNLTEITPGVIENLFAADLAYLQVLYRQINEEGHTILPTTCPECATQYEMDLIDLAGEL